MIEQMPWVSVLLAGPGMASLLLDSSSDLWGITPLLLMGIGAYLVGTASYAVAAYLLMSSAIRQFDSKNGRSQRYPVIRRGGKAVPRSGG